MLELPESPLTPAQVLGALAEMAAQSEAAALRLPETEGSQDVWHGLVFSVAGVRLACAMGEVSEMLPHRDHITRVPGAKPWVLGLSNVRGSLLPVVDMQLFLGGKAIVASKATRILVLRLRGLVVGLLVPSVQGMRHFQIENRLPDARVKGALGAYVYEAFRVGEDVFPVISMQALAADPEFRSAAAQ
jgi:twitching motility protein PilI